MYRFCVINQFGNRLKLTAFKCGQPGKSRKLPRPEPYIGNPDSEAAINRQFLEHEDREARRAESIRTSISRTRSRVYELAACNSWEWFVTFTLNPEKYDRYNLAAWREDFTQFIRNQRRLHGWSVKYLFVPEMHKSGAWHMHGLVMGLPADALRRFTAADFLPYRLLDKIKAGEAVYTWETAAARYGFTCFEHIKSHEGAAGYVTKYISKDIAALRKTLGANLYYASHGLQGKKKISSGYLSVKELESLPNYYNGEYVGVAWVKNVSLEEQLPEAK